MPPERLPAVKDLAYRINLLLRISPERVVELTGKQQKQLFEHISKFQISLERFLEKGEPSLLNKKTHELIRQLESFKKSLQPAAAENGRHGLQVKVETLHPLPRLLNEKTIRNQVLNRTADPERITGKADRTLKARIHIPIDTIEKKIRSDFAKFRSQRTEKEIDPQLSGSLRKELIDRLTRSITSRIKIDINSRALERAARMFVGRLVKKIVDKLSRASEKNADIYKTSAEEATREFDALLKTLKKDPGIAISAERKGKVVRVKISGNLGRKEAASLAREIVRQPEYRSEANKPVIENSVRRIAGTEKGKKPILAALPPQAKSLLAPQLFASPLGREIIKQAASDPPAKEILKTHEKPAEVSRVPERITTLESAERVPVREIEVPRNYRTPDRYLAYQPSTELPDPIQGVKELLNGKSQAGLASATPTPPPATPQSFPVEFQPPRPSAYVSSMDRIVSILEQMVNSNKLQIESKGKLAKQASAVNAYIEHIYFRLVKMVEKGQYDEAIEIVKKTIKKLEANRENMRNKELDLIPLFTLIANLSAHSGSIKELGELAFPSPAPKGENGENELSLPV